MPFCTPSVRMEACGSSGTIVSAWARPPAVTSPASFTTLAVRRAGVGDAVDGVVRPNDRRNDLVGVVSHTNSGRALSQQVMSEGAAVAPRHHGRSLLDEHCRC